MSRFESFLRELVGGAGRLVARAAIADGRRPTIGWVFDAFFLGVVEELESAGVPRRVAADMLGVSRRTLQRQRSGAQGRLDQRRRSIWMQVYEVVERERPTLDELDCHMRRVELRVLGSVVTDMMKAGWLSEESGRLQARPRASLTVEQVHALVVAMVCVGEAVDLDALAVEYQVDLAALQELCSQERGFFWDLEPTRWMAFENVLSNVHRFLEFQLEGKADASDGGMWQLRLEGRPEVEADVRRMVSDTLETLHTGAEEAAVPDEIWDDSHRAWSCMLLSTIA